MRHRTEKGSFFLIISIIFLLFSFTPTMTGAAIGTLQSFSYLHIIGFAFFLISILIFATRQTLDAIIIPTGPSFEEDEERTERAVKEGTKLKDKGYYVISGEKGLQELKHGQRYNIYKELRKSGIKPSQMIVEGDSRNTLENAVYSLRKLKDRDVRDVGIVSYPGHLDRFKDIIKQAQKEGIVDSKFKIHRIETDETLREKFYEFIHNIFRRYELKGGIKKALEAKLVPSRIKRIVEKISNLK